MSDVPKRAHTLALRLDGENLHPNTADPRVTLRIASAYFDALAAVAASTGVELTLTGCEILDKCLSVETNYEPSSRPGIVTSTGLLSQYLTHKAKPGRGTKRFVDDLGRALAELTSAESCDVFIDDERMPLVAAVSKDSLYLSELTSLRCVVIRAGGESPTVRLKAPTESRAFVLNCGSKSQAARLGECLYREIDAEVEIQREFSSGLVIGGEVREFTEVVQSDDPVDQWTLFFSPYKAAWDDVADIDAELARNRYGEDAE